MKKIIKYLGGNWIKYGFETFAILIAILMALALENWNEERKERILEIEILSEIKQNLIGDINDHNGNIGFLSHVVRSSKIVLDHLNNDLPYHDTLATHFAWLPMAANFDAINSGYELWLSEGVNIITNDSLRMSISYIYGHQYKWLRDFLKDRQYLNNQPLFTDMMKKFKTFGLTKTAVPRNYEELKDDDDFKVLVQQNAHIIDGTLGLNENILDQVKRLIDDLEHEIERLTE
jgi:hypothetical protein